MLLSVFLTFFGLKTNFSVVSEYWNASVFSWKRKSSASGVIYRSFLKVDNILKWDLCNSSERILEFS